MIVWAILKHLLLFEMKVLFKDSAELRNVSLFQTLQEFTVFVYVLFCHNFKQNRTQRPSPCSALPLSACNLSMKPILGSLLLLHATQTRGRGPSAWYELTSAEEGHFGSVCAPQPWLSCTQRVSVSCTAQPSSSTTAYQLWWDRPGVNISQLCNVTTVIIDLTLQVPIPSDIKMILWQYIEWHLTSNNGPET